jgi:alpha-galactosidase
MAAADAFIDTGLYDAGYRHFHLDDCWSTVERNATGHIQVDPDGFPNGMQNVVDYVHAKNLTFGLYTSGGNAGCRPNRAGSRGHWQQDAAVFTGAWTG